MIDESSESTDDEAEATAAPGPTPPPSFSDVRARPSRDVAPPLPGAPWSDRLVVGGALLLGVLTDAFTSEHIPAGLGVTLSLLLVLIGLGALTRIPGLALESTGRWGIVAAMVALAVVFSWRASSDLLAMNAFALFVAAILLATRVSDRRLSEVRLVEFLVALLEVPIIGAVRAGQSLRRTFARPKADAQDAAATHSWLQRHGRDIGIGILVALPVLGVFTALLAAADAGFADLVESLFSWNVEDVVLHVLIVALASLVIATFHITALAAVPLERQDERRSHWAGPAVVWIVLGSTSLLFGAFVVLQASYLFGGTDFLDQTAGLSAAEYGRRGFFELTVVAALVVPLLLAFRSWHADSAAGARAYRITAPVLAALTILLQVSAISRMWIYQDRFGLSEQRLYATTILLWLAAGIVWIGVRIALDRAPQLATFAVATGIALIIALDVANPAAIIARTNITRDNATRVDVAYLVDLGPDALPTILDNVDELTAEERASLDVELRRVDESASDDWRGANRSRSRADESLAEYRSSTER